MRCTSLLGLLFAAGAFAVPKAQPFEAAINPLTNPSANERGCGYFRNGKITRPMEGNNRCFSINNEEIQSYVIADGCTCSFFQYVALMLPSFLGRLATLTTK